MAKRTKKKIVVERIYNVGDKIMDERGNIGTITNIDPDEYHGDFVTVDFNDGKPSFDIGPNLAKHARQKYIDNVENKG